MYKYFKGEKLNPFDQVKQNPQFQFWGYEKMFDDQFAKGDFSTEVWTVPYAEDVKEWKEVLNNEPVNKEELFKLWLYRLLMEHLPEKHLSESDYFLKLYNQ